MAYKIISPLPIVEGGTEVQSFTSYAVICGGATGTAPLQSIGSVGTVDYVLKSQGVGMLPAFVDIATLINLTTGTGFTGTLQVDHGGTGATVLNDHSVLVGSGASTVTTLPVGVTGQVLMGSTGADPSFGTISCTYVSTSTASFNNVLSAADSTVQLSLDTIDDFGSGAGDQTVNLYTGAGVKTVTLGSGNTTSITTVDCGTGGATFGTTANAHTTTVGSTTGVSATTIQSGTGGIAISATNGAITANSGTGTVEISTDATANTLNLGTGAGVKTVTLGSTDTTSVTNLQSGTGGICIPAFAEGALVTSAAGKISTVTGTAGYVLTANAAGTAPSFQASTGGVTSITGDSGGAQTGAITLTGGSTGASFAGAAGTITMAFAGITANGGVVSLGTDAADNAINIGTAANAGRVTTIGNATGTSSVAINCGTGGVTVGTSANAHSTTLGSTNSTSATTVQSGSGALAVTSTNGTLTINSGTGSLSISNDASATTVNIATGGAAKTVTLGSTTTTSKLDLKYGTADFTLASATGTVMSALDTGEIVYPLQPAFLAYKSSSTANATGTGDYTVIEDTEVYDQNGDFNNSTGVFTAPVTGRYCFQGSIIVGSFTAASRAYSKLATSNRTYNMGSFNPTTIQSGTGYVGLIHNSTADMDAADTASLVAYSYGEASAVNSVYGTSNPQTYFSGFLAC